MEGYPLVVESGRDLAGRRLAGLAIFTLDSGPFIWYQEHDHRLEKDIVESPS